MATTTITGYTDKVSVAPGAEISFHISVENADSAHVEIVRLIHGDEHPDGPGFIEEVIASSVAGDHPVKKQFVDVGNAVVVDDPADYLALTGPLTIHAYIFPTTPNKGRQVLLGRFSLTESAGYALGINGEGRLTFWVGDGSDTDEITSQVPLMHHTWYFVSASFDPRSGKALLHQEAVVGPYNGRLGKVAPFDHRSSVEQKLRIKPKSATTPFMWGAASNSAPIRGSYKDFTYNGKIDRSGVFDRALTIDEMKAVHAGQHLSPGPLVNWDTAEGYGPDGIDDLVRDTGPNALHGRGVQRPVRAMTGYNWSGKHDDWRVAP
ncbi:MAG: LamG domain-containing protein, partial [Actinobacteria bacterium]|nr:LamG domain-containing protein [Actinomycetota bacterium]